MYRRIDQHTADALGIHKDDFLDPRVDRLQTSVEYNGVKVLVGQHLAGKGYMWAEFEVLPLVIVIKFGAEDALTYGAVQAIHALWVPDARPPKVTAPIMLETPRALNLNWKRRFGDSVHHLLDRGQTVVEPFTEKMQGHMKVFVLGEISVERINPQLILHFRQPIFYRIIECDSNK